MERSPFSLKTLLSLELRESSTGDAWATLGPEGVFTRASEAFAGALGHNTTALVGRFITDFLHPEQRDFAFQMCAAVSDGLEEVERAWLFVQPDGSYRGVLARIAALPIGESVAIVQLIAPQFVDAISRNGNMNEA